MRNTRPIDWPNIAGELMIAAEAAIISRDDQAEAAELTRLALLAESMIR